MLPLELPSPSEFLRSELWFVRRAVFLFSLAS